MAEKTGVYLTSAGYWVMLKQVDGEQWKPQTNDFEFYFNYIDRKFEWSKDKENQQHLLDALAKRLHLKEVPLRRVRETYSGWGYPG